MACPCATILAASTAISAAIGVAARRHILIKGGRYLEAINTVDTICFDKTGTLTTNQPEIRQLVNLNGMPEDELLRLAHSTEIHNSHPVALAIKEEARRRGLTTIQHDVCEYILGKGMRSVIHGDEVLVGSHKLLDHFEIAHPVVDDFLEKNKKQGLTQVFIARNGEIVGVMGFANRERPDLNHLIANLKRQGIRRTAKDAAAPTQPATARISSRRWATPGRHIRGPAWNLVKCPIRWPVACPRAYSPVPLPRRE